MIYKNLEDLKKDLYSKGMSEEQVNSFIDKIQPFFDFNNYLKDMLNIDDETVEDLTESYMKRELQKKIDILSLEDDEEDDDIMKKLFDISSEIMYNFSKKYNYPEEEALKLKNVDMGYFSKISL